VRSFLFTLLSCAITQQKEVQFCSQREILLYDVGVSDCEESESRLLVLRDTGVDSEHKCFVILLSATSGRRLGVYSHVRLKARWT
jgi:hypothetical protein